MPHGTTRVERGIVGAFAERRHSSIGFVAFERKTGRFSEIAQDAIAGIVAAPLRRDWSRDRAGPWRRRIRGIGSRLRRLVTQSPTLPPGPADPFAASDTVLFCGEHSRHDFSRLLALKRAKRLRFAFVLFDLLQVLPDDDPRLCDPDTADLPQTDFMVREADLILPISHFSARELRQHLARRRVTGPPIHPIRLAGALRSMGDGTPVPGLEPGRFVLTVGDVVERKNHVLLVRVWAALGEAAPVLVSVGRIDPESNALVDRVRGDAALRDRIRFLPHLDDDALAWLYRHCRYTVFPSRKEGFGLPVAESLAYGKVCLASSSEAIPEAGQGSAISLGPDDDASWLAAIRRLADDDALRGEEARVAVEFRPVAWRDTTDDVLDAFARLGLP